MWFFSRSGWSDRFPHLPLGQSHPEEDRAGQGFLTEPPRAGHPTEEQQAGANGPSAADRQAAINQGADSSTCLSSTNTGEELLDPFEVVFVFFY